MLPDYNVLFLLQVEKLDPTMEQWLPAGKTKGTSIDIKNLAEGRVYKFLVRAVSAEGDSPDLETEETVVAKDPFDPPTPPQKGERDQSVLSLAKMSQSTRIY